MPDTYDKIITTMSGADLDFNWPCARSRTHFELHKTYQDAIQQIFIRMAETSYIRPHMHQHEWQEETLLVLSGKFLLVTFDQEGNIRQSYPLSNLEDSISGNSFVVKVPAKTWHTLLCMEEGCLYEVKQGPYSEDDAKIYASWAPAEQSSDYIQFLKDLKSSVISN